MPISKLTTGSISDSVAIDTNTLVVDGTNNRVGVGTASPSLPLEVSGSFGGVAITNTTTTAGTTRLQQSYSGGTAELRIGSNTNANTTSAMYIKSGDAGNVIFNGYVTMQAQPAFYAYGGNTTGASAGIYTVEFTAAHVNTGNHYNTSNYRFTCPVAGVYYFSYKVMAYTNSYLRMGIYKNGSIVGQQSFSEAEAYANNTYDIITSCSVNDYIEVKADVGSAGEGHIHSSYRFFVGYLIG